jgi:glycosyltransferase involved in cell wall biosynthesis
MSQHERHEASIYIGPAALCPNPEHDRPYLLITGDQDDWVQPLIQERVKRTPENHLFEVRHHTIGKAGTTKTWHTFNHPSLNGIHDEETIRWCNPAWIINHLGCKEIENKKLQDILSESKLVQNKFHLTIAQGDPHLTLKRSEKLLKNCLSIDLSLHPLALIWRKSIDQYLTEQGFVQSEASALKWQRKEQLEPAEALAKPSESEHFLHTTVQCLLNTINLEEVREAGFAGSDLFLLQQVVLGKISSQRKQSIRSLLKTRTQHQINKIFSAFKKNKQPLQKTEAEPQQTSCADQKQAESLNETWQEFAVHRTKQLRGHIDGLQGNFILRGWVDASDFGEEPSTLTVFWDEKNQIIGEGQATLERPDLAAAGIKGDCGFAIDLKALKALPLHQILDSSISLRVVERKSQQTIGDQAWTLDIETNKNSLEILFSEELTIQRKEQIFDYLGTSKTSKYLQMIREHIFKCSAMECMSNRWVELPVIDLINLYKKNSSLNYGIAQESSSRLEVILHALISLINAVDTDGINRCSRVEPRKQISLQAEDLNTIASNIQERSFSGLQPWEKALFDEHIRPLCDALICTIFLQSNPKRLKEQEQKLLKALAKSFQETYNDLRISFYFFSILKSQNDKNFDPEYTNLAHKMGDRFTYLLSHYTRLLEQKQTNDDLFYYAAAIDFATHCPALHRNIADKIKQLLPAHLREHPRQSKPRHWVERLGWISSNSAQIMVSKMLVLGFSRSSVIGLHQEMIEIKRDLADLLWNRSTTKENPSSEAIKQRVFKKWLIVGEKALSQCWMYRVEQKKTYLEKLGCEVRCIDHVELRSWSFSHDVLWADAVIFCRLPAMYPYLRAVSFAKECGKKTYAEIDDLLFTPDYPAEFESYGGSIPIEQYKNLCIDYPLRLGILNAVDEIIVSTTVLGETCRQVLDSSSKPIHVIPNLPLHELEHTASTLTEPQAWERSDKKLKIVLTSGTLSHKQVLKDFIYPVLLEALEKFKEIELTTVGHIELPSTFRKFKGRIHSAPFSNYSTYLNLIKQASIALVPLEVHPTTDAKSAIKWMEASMCGVASICSPVRAYTDVTINQKDVMIASNLDEWRACLNTLIEQPEKRQALARRAYESATRQFSRSYGEQIWSKLIHPNGLRTKQSKKKVLVINVFFAPQSVGGATRVAQDYVQGMLDNQKVDYDVSVLCTDYDSWQTDINKESKNLDQKSDVVDIKATSPNKLSSLFGTTADELVQLQENWIQGNVSYRDSISIDYSHWRGAKVVRLNLPPKPWAIHEDRDIEAFCTEYFRDEQFDLIQCHCCQIITASPLIAAQKLGIPYEIIMHDAWWMSHEQFLVSPAGNLIDPSDPLGHFDEDPSEEEKAGALARRQSLYDILTKAKRRVAVSEAFRGICEAAGISDVEVQENQFTSMANEHQQIKKTREGKALIKICHIGGMSLHKGYQLFRQAVHSMDAGLNLEFTVVDHRLASQKDEYRSIWNGYRVQFIAPIAMDKMNGFYTNQDVLVAPSIWPESFGLVTREALSAGLWVIASNAGALAEPLLTNRSTQGTVIRPNHLEDLVKALTECPQQVKDYV